MESKSQTDHVAILALMLVGVLIKRMTELDQLDDVTARHVHRLIVSVRTHSQHEGLSDLDILFDNISRTLSKRGIIPAES